MKHHEENVIGGLLKGIITTTDIKLSAVDLRDYATIFRLIKRIETEGVQPDVEIVYQRSVETEEYYTLNDFRRLENLPISAATCLASARILRQVSLKAELTEQVNRLFTDTSNLSGGGLLQKLQTICNEADLGYSEVKQGFQSAAEITGDLEKVYDDLYAGVSFCVPTYFPQIDDAILDGFSKADLHIVVGFTGAGKSSLMQSFSLPQLLNGHHVGIVSREMSKTEVLMRMQTALTNIPRWHIRKGLHRTDLEKLKANLKEMAKLPLSVNTETATVEDLRLQVKTLVEAGGLDILYVDYLQLMKSSGNHGSRTGEVQTVSRTLKEIAMENNIPVVALCQFNRNAQNTSVFEIMYQLKESSSLEQDASTIIFVQVEKTQEIKQVKTASVTILKHRNGTPFTTFDLEFEGQIFTFREPSAQPVGSWYER